ncbi:hypothetical protein RclHR1_01700007 [Rhizophagus clarus]|nr:hypothetical protein RclHR1_01700007 [Rhizophagus clarus]
MTELSKMASISWKNLSEEEKATWKRKYEINRDLPSNSSEEKDPFNENDEKTVDEKDDESIETATDNIVIKEE